MERVIVRLVRAELKSEGYRVGSIDDVAGPKTEAALDKALAKRRESIDDDDWRAWPRTRKVTAYVQLISHEKGIDAGVVDGYWGQVTNFAFDSLAYLKQHGTLPAPWRDMVPLDVNPHGWPKETQAELKAFYGSPRERNPTLARVELPYVHQLAWDKRKRLTSFLCHPKVAGSIRHVLTRVVEHYGLQGIKDLGLDVWGGCYAYRAKRGGTSLSTHSWGIAMDYDPEHNQLSWGRGRSRFAQPQYEAWWRFWEEDGWTSLGRTANFDWMHVQAARRR